MKTRRQGAILSIMAASTAVWACNKQPKVENARIARVSDANRQSVLDAQHRVDVARTNLNSAEVGVREARQFRDVVSEELSAAKNQSQAAANAIELGRQTRDSAMATTAEQKRDAANTRLRAAQAKDAFANSLVTVREKKRDAAKAHVSLAEAQRELAKFDAAHAAGTARGLARNDFVNAELKARQNVETAETDAKQAEEETRRLRKLWEDAKSNVAEAERSAMPDVPPPEEPTEIQP